MDSVSGPSRNRLAVALVVGLLIGVLTAVWVDRADAAPAPQARFNSHCPPPGYPGTCADYFASKFRRGDLGRTNHFGRVMTPRVRNMILAAHFANTARVTRAMRESWWEGFVSSVSCSVAANVTWGQDVCGMADYVAAPRDELSDTQRVELGCGGAAVLGSLRGGGWWGAGIGGGGCLWAFMLAN